MTRSALLMVLGLKLMLNTKVRNDRCCESAVIYLQESTRQALLVKRDLPGGTVHILCSSRRRIVLIFLLLGWYSSWDSILSSLPETNTQRMMGRVTSLPRLGNTFLFKD